MNSGKRDEFVAGSGRRRQVKAIRALELTMGGRRPYVICRLIVGGAPAFFGLALLVPSYAAAAESEEIAVLRRMLGELKTEN